MNTILHHSTMSIIYHTKMKLQYLKAQINIAREPEITIYPWRAGRLHRVSSEKTFFMKHFVAEKNFLLNQKDFGAETTVKFTRKRCKLATFHHRKAYRYSLWDRRFLSDFAGRRQNQLPPPMSPGVSNLFRDHGL